MRRLTLLALLGAALVLPSCGGEALRVKLATTTSTYASGLLDDLLPAFTDRTGIEVDVLSVGTGQALALGERGDVDVVLVHARAREDAFLEEGHASARHDVMWNDFVIVGPEGDPAEVRGLEDASAALAQIAASGARFVSRGDDSGTHIRERELWKRSGLAPPWAEYLSAGQGMGACITIAEEKQAYLLVDRGTWLARRADLDLVLLVEGDPALRNPYGVLLVDGTRHPGGNPEGGRALFDFLTSPEGQDRIGAFRVGGEQLFHPLATD